jgi:NADH dehydrogenase
MMGTGSGSQVTVLGGSGFVGRYVVRELARAGWRVRVGCRHPEHAGFLQPLGDVGQVVPLRADILDAASLRRAVEGADAVVNLVGILAEGGRQRFSQVHAEGTKRLAEVAKECGIERFVQVSAIGADVNSPARYARSKGEAERHVLAINPLAVVLRPSIVFGEEDEFFNRFARMAQLSPLLPAVGFGRTRFQPVYVGDVAKAVAVSLAGGAQAGTIYELGGPQVYSFAELLRMTQRYAGRKERLLPIPFFVGAIQGFVLQYLPGKILTLDQVRMLRTDNVVSAAAMKDGRTLRGLGIEPTAVESVVPLYLARYQYGGALGHIGHK